MSMRRRLFVSFGIGVVLMLGVSGLRSIANWKDVLGAAIATACAMRACNVQCT